LDGRFEPLLRIEGNVEIQVDQDAPFLFPDVFTNLKVAGELNLAKMFEGALLKYLETRLFFGLLITAAENEDVAHLRERSAEIGRQLKADKTDQSIAALFWEMAETSLNPTGKTEPTAAQIKRAAVILNIVLPSYSDYMKETK